MKIAAAFLAARMQDDDLAALRAGDIALKCAFPTAAAVCCGAKSALIGTLANGLHIPIQNRGEKAIFPASSQIMSGSDGEVLIGPQPGAPGMAMRSGRCDHGHRQDGGKRLDKARRTDRLFGALPPDAAASSHASYHLGRNVRARVFRANRALAQCARCGAIFCPIRLTSLPRKPPVCVARPVAYCLGRAATQPICRARGAPDSGQGARGVA